jgi:cyanophycinase
MKRNRSKSDFSRRKGKAKPRKRGSLIIVGGNEDKEEELVILKEIAKKAGNGKLIVATLASDYPKEVWTQYQGIFKRLGVKAIEHLSISQHEEARRCDVESLFKDANAFFFSGGDQLKITTKIGGSPIMEKIFELFESGGTIAGTSAGAAVMGKTMLVGGENTESHKVGNWMMAPGAGLLENMIIDQHFAQRGRIGRLLGAVSLNPGVLGVGIDENTAIIVEGDAFRVLGENAVYIIDGTSVSYTNISEASAENTMSIHDVKLHILAEGEGFDLVSRRPTVDGL